MRNSKKMKINEEHLQSEKFLVFLLSKLNRTNTKRKTEKDENILDAQHHEVSPVNVLRARSDHTAEHVVDEMHLHLVRQQTMLILEKRRIEKKINKFQLSDSC